MVDKLVLSDICQTFTIKNINLGFFPTRLEAHISFIISINLYNQYEIFLNILVLIVDVFTTKFY